MGAASKIMSASKPYLGIYSPEGPHESAQIVGTRAGLEALYVALQKIFVGDDFLSVRDPKAPIRFDAIDPSGEPHEVLVALVDDNFFARDCAPGAPYLDARYGGPLAGPLEDCHRLLAILGVGSASASEEAS